MTIAMYFVMSDVTTTYQTGHFPEQSPSWKKHDEIAPITYKYIMKQTLGSKCQ